jgi:hypothetical protein
VQMETVRAVMKFVAICMTLDGATNKAGKQVLNMMAAGPFAFFLEHFTMDLMRETSDNLLQRLLSARRRLRVSMGLILDAPAEPVDQSSNVMGIEDEESPVPKIEEPMWNLCTDSPNVMIGLRRKALQSGEFIFAYGCAPHGFHNLSMDWVKLAGPKRIVSQNVFIVTKINSVHLLITMFDHICAQKHGKSYALILFTKTRWCTVYNMVRRNILVKSTLVAMPNATDHDEEFEDATMDNDLRDVILDVPFWKATAALETLLKPLCAAVGYLEGDEATFSAVYACFLSVTHHVRVGIDDASLEHLNVGRDDLMRFVCSRLKTIYTSAHALAFYTDPFFYNMRRNLASIHGPAFLNLECGPLIGQCRKALERIAIGDNSKRGMLLEQFAYFCALRMDGSYMMVSRKLKPHLIWGQVDDPDMFDLAKVLVQVHCNPTGAVGGERNHKTNNRVRTKQRVRLGRGKCEKQVAIAYNSAQLERVMGKKRQDPFLTHLAALGSPAPDRNRYGDDDENGEHEEEEDFEDDEDEFRIVENPTSILDQYLDDGEFEEEEILEDGIVLMQQGHGELA